MKKRIFPFLLIVFMLLTMLGACAPQPTATSAPPAPTQPEAIPTAAETKPTEASVQPTTVPKAEEIHWVFLNALPYAEDWWKQVLDKYMAEHPGQTYEFSSTPWEEFFGKFSTAAAGGSEIDLLFVDTSLVKDLNKMKALVDLTDKVGDTSAFRLDSVNTLDVVDGHIFALPLDGFDMMSVYYNKEIFKKYNLEVPKTYDDLVAISKTLRQNGIQPLVTAGTPGVYWLADWTLMKAQLTEDPFQYNVDLVAGKNKFTDDVSLEAFRWLRKMKDDGVWADGIQGIDNDTSVAMFLNGQAGLFFSGSWKAPTLEKAGGTDKFGVILFPQIGKYPARAIGGPSMGISIFTGIKPEKMDAAVDIVKFITNAESDKTLTELNGAAFAARKDVTPDVGPLTKEFTPLAETSVPWDEWWWSQQVKEAMYQYLPSLVGGQITPEEAAANIQKAFDESQK